MRAFIIIVVILSILILGYLTWNSIFKKNAENGSCNMGNNCQAGLKCINNICSSGKAGSFCTNKTDCQTEFCVQGKCTEGIKNNTCYTYKDCKNDLYCVNEACSESPSYNQYFDGIIIYKVKLGIPSGPKNVPVLTSEFKITDGMEIDLLGVKPAINGLLYYEALNLETDQTVFSSLSNKQKIEGKDVKIDSDLPGVVGQGEYQFNVYFNDELVYITKIKIID